MIINSSFIEVFHTILSLLDPDQLNCLNLTIRNAMSLPKAFPLKVADAKTIQIPSVGFGTWAAGERHVHVFRSP